MMDWLIALGVLVWTLATILTFVFLSNSGVPIIKRVYLSIISDFRRSAGLKALTSSFQVVGIYWIVIGVLINQVEENWPSGSTGELILLILIGAPLFVGAVIIDKLRGVGRRKK